MLQEVEAMLVGSVSMDPPLREQAFLTLKRLESSPMFLFSLLEIFRTNGDQQIRFLAICCCRNVVGRLFPSLPVDLKQRIKCVLIELLTTSVEFFNEIVEIVCRVARIDFPANWSELLTFLTTREIKTKEEMTRFSRLLYAVVKAQESKKLMKDRRETLAVSPQLLESVLPLWTPNRGSDRYLDCALIRLCRIGFLRLHELPFNRTLIPMITDLISMSDNREKIWKEISALFVSQTMAFVNSVGITKVLELAVIAIKTGQGREYPITVLHHALTAELEGSALNQRNEFLASTGGVVVISDLIVTRFLVLDESDVREWIKAPDESLGGPLDGDWKRSEAEEFLKAVMSDELLVHALSRIELALTEGVWDVCDAWLALVVLQQHNSLAETLFGRFFSEEIFTNEWKILFQFRVLQLVRTAAVSMQLSTIRSAVSVLCNTLKRVSNLCIGLSVFFSLKVLYERSSDDMVWVEAGPVMMQAGATMLPLVNAPDVMWRVLNAVTLFASSGGPSVNSSLLKKLFLSKDPLIRSAIIDLLKSNLVAADDVGEGVTEELLLCCLEIVLHATMFASESMLDGACSLLVSVMRVAFDRIDSYNHLIHRICAAAIKLMEKEDIFVESLIDCLVEFDVILAEAGRRDLNVSREQLAIAGKFLEVSESVDEVFVLLEVLVAIEIDVLVEVIKLTADQEYLENVVGVIASACASNPTGVQAVMKSHPLLLSLVEAVLNQLKLARLPRTKFRLINALSVLCSLTVETSSLLPQLCIDLQSAELSNDSEELLRQSFKLHSNRLSGMPKPVRREGFLESLRSVDVAALRLRLVHSH